MLSVYFVIFEHNGLIWGNVRSFAGTATKERPELERI